MKGVAFGRFRNDQEWVVQDGGKENIAEEITEELQLQVKNLISIEKSEYNSHSCV